MRRRDFITLLGGTAAAWPIAAGAQQRPALPVIGFLNPALPDGSQLRAFANGLKEIGYVAGENVAIETRSAENQLDRLPALAVDLVHGRVAVIVAATEPAIAAAKAATTTIPIVFAIGEDPVRRGLVASLARPGGNLTGVNFFATELASKRLELLHLLLPAAVRVAVLVSPANASITTSTLAEVEQAARIIGLTLKVFNADTGTEIDAAFAKLGRERPDAMFVGPGPFFTSRRVQLAHWTTRLAIPAIFAGRAYSEVGGLISYGSSVTDAYRQIGLYAGRILKGAKPADLPVVQTTKFELVINQATARILGLTVPAPLLAIADEVIE